MSRVRTMLGEDHDEKAFAAGLENGRCPVCGDPVLEVNAEPLELVKLPDGTTVAESMVFVVLPCGHDFTRKTSFG